MSTLLQTNGSAKVMLWLAPDWLPEGATTVTFPIPTSSLYIAARPGAKMPSSFVNNMFIQITLHFSEPPAECQRTNIVNCFRDPVN
jgi:hypothetical protein